MENKKIVLVTGCCGFIGFHVAEKLLKRGDLVIGVDEMNEYYSLEQKEQNLEDLREFENFVFYKEDICSINIMREIFDKHSITYVAHLAARAGVRPSIDDPILYVKSNIEATTVILEMIREFKCENSVITSSSSVFGECSDVPFTEEFQLDKPISPYAATKKSCELMSYTYHHLYNININIVRPFTIYGPRGRPDMAPYIFMSKISRGDEIVRYGAGDTYRDYTYIDDFVDGFVRALDIPLGYEIFNLGNSSPISLNEFISTIEDVVGKNANIKQVEMQAGDVTKTYADISKANRLLGYSPQVSLKEGMKEMWEWFREV